jgi:hypothetical protein
LERAATKRCAVGTKDMSGAWHRTGSEQAPRLG